MRGATAVSAVDRRNTADEARLTQPALSRWLRQAVVDAFRCLELFSLNASTERLLRQGPHNVHNVTCPLTTTCRHLERASCVSRARPGVPRLCQPCVEPRLCQPWHTAKGAVPLG